MRKNFLGILLCLSIIFTCIPSTFAYTAGPNVYEVALGKPVNIKNATCNKTAVYMGKNSKAVYEICLPFDSIGLSFNFASKEDLDIIMFIDGKVFEISDKAYKFNEILRKGEHQVVLTSKKDVDIYKMTFEKENIYLGTAKSCVPNLTPFEHAVETAVILAPNTNILKVNGARRYINPMNVKETPLSQNGQMYLPIHTFSRTFGYYYEKNDSMVLLQISNTTFLEKDGFLTKQVGNSNPVQIDNVLLHKNGEVYVPVVYFSQYLGKTVKARDGITIIDYNSNVNNILQDVYFNELKKEFSNYVVTPKAGTTYYVSKDINASDDNDGTAQAPFLTLNRAGEVAIAGDTVIIGGGEYNETFIPKNDGTATNPIIFKAKENEKVIISALENVGNASDKYGEMLVYDLKVDLGDGRNQIFYNDDILVAGRHPNSHTSDRKVPDIKLSSIWPTQGNIHVSSSDSHLAVSDTDLDQDKDYWKGGTIVALTGAGWSLGTAKISGSKKGELYLTDECKKWWFEGGHDGDYAYITDHINTVDLPGEWAIKDNKLYIMPPKGETAETFIPKQKARQLVIDIADRKYVQIQGIDTIGGGMRLNDSEMCMLEGGTYRYISHYTHGMDQREGFIEKADIYNPNGAPPRGEMGIYIGGSDNIVINSHISYSASSGIYAVGKYAYIENNIISDCGYMGSYVGGVFLSTEAWKPADTPRGGFGVYSNTIYNSGRYTYGVSTNEEIYGTEGVPSFLPDDVAYNEFYNGSICSRDTGTVYLHAATMGTDKLKSKFRNNLVSDSWSFDSFNIGIYYDNYMRMAEIYDNVIFYTNPDIKYATEVYAQLKSAYPTTFAYVEHWNNSLLGLVTGGKDSLTKGDYPSGKMFSAGAYARQKSQTPQLDSIGVINKNTYTSNVVKTSKGVEIENGIMNFTDKEQWICFQDVDFSSDLNNIRLSFTGDYYKTGDMLEIYVGKNIENATYSTVAKTTCTSPYLDSIQTVDIPVRKVSGIQNVYVKTADFKSVGIESISVSKVLDPYADLVAQVYASEGEIIKSGKPNEKTQPAGTVGNDYNHQYLQNTWGGSVICYKNVVIGEDVDTACYSAGTAGEHSGIISNIRIDSQDGEVIAQINTVKDDWNNFERQEFELNKILEKGTYDIYITYESKDKSSNFYWFGFKNSKASEVAE